MSKAKLKSLSIATIALIVTFTIFCESSIKLQMPLSIFAEARKHSSSGSRSSSHRKPMSNSSSSSRSKDRGISSSKRKRNDDQDKYDDSRSQGTMDFGFLDQDDYDNIDDDAQYDEYDNDVQYDEDDIEEDYYSNNRGRPSSSSRRSSSGGARSNGYTSSSSSRQQQHRGGRGRDPRRSGGGRRGQSSNVVPYGRRQIRQPQPSAFTRGIAALRESIPDASTIKDTAINSLSAAKETTSKLTSNIYREVKGLTSSELEQVMLKATAPNDSPVKGKHVERLVGVTYQISGRYDIYDAVLRKLWSKMVEKDWRTTIKALYILHRFSADGAPDHQAALKARLRELRRTRDPKRGKEKYFNSKQLLSGDTSSANIPFRAFLARYAHYVLLRAQCFGGMFTEIANDPNQTRKAKSKASSSSSQKCITSTCLKNEHLEAAKMLLKAGLACDLKSNGEEECENTAIALERVVSDLIGLTGAVTTALNNALKGDYDNDPDVDWDLIKQWCQFYSEELCVETKVLMKKTTPILDTYGLFLPSRIGANLSQELLQKGLKGKSTESKEAMNTNQNEASPEKNQESKQYIDDEDGETEQSNGDQNAVDENNVKEEEDEYDEYDEYEYEEYDEEE